MKEGNVVQQRGLYRSEFEHDNYGSKSAGEKAGSL